LQLPLTTSIFKEDQMKKWISLVTCVACTLSSLTYADAAAPVVPDEETVQLAVSPELTVDEADATPDAMASRKQVGAGAEEGSKAGSRAGKYVLAGCAIAVAVTALILVSRHSGHHHKHGTSH
jgi:hypothetical protein